MPDIPDGFGEMGGTFHLALWALREGIDWSEYGEAAPTAGEQVIIISYTVTTGKTLLIYDISAACTSGSALFYIYVHDWTANKIKFTKGAIEGLHESFPQPIAIPSAHQLYVILKNFEAIQHSFAVALLGYEL